LDPLACWERSEANAVTAANFLAALPASGEHVVLVSTISVYGRPAVCPIPEAAATVPVTGYGLAKLYAERIAQMWAGHSDCGLTIARLTQVYGPGSDASMAVSIMLATAQADGTIQVRCDPDILRDYLYLDDAARMLVEIAAVRPSGVVNVGSGQGTRIADLAQIAAAVCAAAAPIIVGGPTGPSLVLDTRYAESLGIRSRTSLRDGLALLADAL
jgi:UDP-glucose 4-epimerase